MHQYMFDIMQICKIELCTHTHCTYTHNNTHKHMRCGGSHGVATVSRLLKIIGLFCKKDL